MQAIAYNPEMQATAYTPTRLAVEWDGECWAEIDPASGVCVAVGEKPYTKGVVDGDERMAERPSGRG